MVANQLIIARVMADFQQEYCSDGGMRQKIRKTCEKLSLVIKQTSKDLKQIHYNNDITVVCRKAREGLKKVQQGYAELVAVVPEGCYSKYYGNWRCLTQRACYLYILTTWLEDGSYISHKMVAENLGISPIEQKNAFQLEVEDYLIGLLRVVSQLKRFTKSSIVRGDYSQQLKVCKFAMDVNDGFRSLNMKNGYLRKRFDGLKYDVKKIESVVFMLRLRGLLPKEEEGEEKTEITRC